MVVEHYISPPFESQLNTLPIYQSGELVDLIPDPTPSQPRRHRAVFRPSNQKWEYKEQYAAAPFEQWLEMTYPGWEIVKAFPHPEEDNMYNVILKHPLG